MPKIQNIVLGALSNAKQKFAFRNLHLLLFGEPGGDALRNTLATIFPGLMLYHLGHLHEAILVGLGALFASLTDLPGNRQDKRNTALWTIPLYAFTAFLTASAITLPALLILWLMIAAFLFTMVSVYGGRFPAVGLGSLILMTFTVGLWPENPASYTLYITLGVIWYFSVSLFQSLCFPYRSLRYAVTDSFHKMAILLKNKAQFYDESIPLEVAYKQLGRLHLGVSEQQEQVRNLLLRERGLLAGSSISDTYWVRQAVGVTDLYELLTALDHDYDAIRKQLAPFAVLDKIRALILLLSEEVDYLSWKSGGAFAITKRVSKDPHIQRLLEHLSVIRDQLDVNTAQILGATLRNTYHILDCIQRIRQVFEKDANQEDISGRFRYASFLSSAPKGMRALRTQFTFQSAVFPFALRLALLFGIGGIIGLFLPEYQYTYWILITLVVVARPSFANTNTRNAQRILGTLAGLLIGGLLIYITSSPTVLLSIAVFGLFGFFLFNRLDYMLSVMSLTPAIILALHLYEGNIVDILGSRLIFTLIGCLLAIGGWFFIPFRQGGSLQKLAEDIIRQGDQYMEVIHAKIGGQDVDANDVRLARKLAHSALASFSSAIDQARREPGAKQKWRWSQIYAFHSLAYRANSLMIGLSVAATELSEAAEAKNALLPRAVYLDGLQKELQQMLPSFR